MNTPVVTVTPHVAIDQAVILDRLVPGMVHRAQSVCCNAGGKGVAVSSCLADWGVRSGASGFLGAGNAGIFESLCRCKGIGDLFVRVPGLASTNVKLMDSLGSTGINLPGMSVSSEDIAMLEGVLERAARWKPGVAVLAGGLPEGCPENFYARMTARFDKAGFKVILDTAGAALAQSLEGADIPYCVKLNRHELSEWSGKRLNTPDRLMEEAERLLARGVSLAAISLGAEGALFVSDEGALHAWAKAEIVLETAGAGDAMVAGMAAALCEGASLERIARLSTAFSVGKLGLPGPNIPPAEEVEAIAARVNIKAIRSRKERLPERQAQCERGPRRATARAERRAGT